MLQLPVRYEPWVQFTHGVFYVGKGDPVNSPSSTRNLRWGEGHAET